jgi:hypothetical protein
MPDFTLKNRISSAKIAVSVDLYVVHQGSGGGIESFYLADVPLAKARLQPCRKRGHMGFSYLRLDVLSRSRTSHYLWEHPLADRSSTSEPKGPIFRLVFGTAEAVP